MTPPPWGRWDVFLHDFCTGMVKNEKKIPVKLYSFFEPPQVAEIF